MYLNTSVPLNLNESFETYCLSHYSYFVVFSSISNGVFQIKDRQNNRPCQLNNSIRHLSVKLKEAVGMDSESG